MHIYNVEYRILDKLGRTKQTLHGGLFVDEEKVEEFKHRILEKEKGRKIAFDVYPIQKGLFGI